MISNKSFSYFYFSIVCVLGIFMLAFVLFIYGVLMRANEDLSLGESVELQLKTGAIFKPLELNEYRYKMELLKMIKPKVIALGSSRVLQLREESFSASFLSMGRAMNHLNEGLVFLKEMVHYHKPEVILLGLDFWWFNIKLHQPSSFGGNDTKQNMQKKINTMMSKIFKGELSFDILRYSFGSNAVTNYKNIGINALQYSNGFRPDGSYQYASFILGDGRNSDIAFSNTFERIAQGNKRFEYGEMVSAERMQILYDIIDFCKQNGIKLVAFIPPLANEVIEKMESYGSKYYYIREFREKIKQLEIESYDFHDMRKYVKNSCEFFDGFHGGEVLYQRILKEIYHADSILKNYLNIKLIEETITEFSGKTLIIYDKSKFKKIQENDFLQLGCKK